MTALRIILIVVNAALIGYLIRLVQDALANYREAKKAYEESDARIARLKELHELYREGQRHDD